MTTINNGGPAFPQTQILDGDRGFVSGNDVGEGGMTLRDYFAAKAMNGLLAQSLGTALESEPKIAADYAYATADAMLKARMA